jgi:hypothetical protein
VAFYANASEVANVADIVVTWKFSLGMLDDKVAMRMHKVLGAEVTPNPLHVASELVQLKYVHWPQTNDHISRSGK